MTTSVSTTGSISSAGIGSGLDVSTIVTKLMSVEKIPLTQLQSRATSIQTTISTFGAVQSALSSFRDAARNLTSPSTWSQMSATSGDAGAVTVSTASGATAGSYAVNVSNLATAQSTVSGTYASASAPVGAGSLHIDIAGAGGFADPSTGGVDIALASSDTLQTLTDKINSANAGVSAAIVTDASGARLVLTASKTGVANDFRVAGTNSDGGSGLAALSFDPRSTTPGATTQSQAGADAHATINGLAVTSASNTLSGVLPGLTIGLLKQTTAAVQVGVSQDTGSIKTAINAFATAYNALSSLLATDIKYDSATKTAGPLQADSTAVALQRQLRNVLGASTSASATFSTLSSVGLQVQSDGTLKVDDAKLGNALGNPAELKKAFATTAAGGMVGPSSGFAQQFRSLGDGAIGIAGTLTTRVAGLNKTLTHNQRDQSALQDRLNTTEARIRAQYTALDTKMSSISTLSTYVTQQIANWNKSTG